MEKRIFILAGPSGSGKNTILKKLLGIKNLNLSRVVTCTARPKREDEEEGVDHFFVSKDEFIEKIDAGDFFEYENVHGHLYGILKSSFKKNKNYLLEIDIRGALSVKKLFPNAKIIFIDSSKKSLILRLQKRGESVDSISTRMKTAEKEWHFIDQADVVIENKDNRVDQTVNQVVDFLNQFYYS
jgi:guanylate kinase